MVDTGHSQRTWLVTGAAGFIGSHLVERLLTLDQRVIGIDNFSTGSRKNVEAVRSSVSSDKAARFTFFEQDIRDRKGLADLIRHHVPQVILHQAALGSVPRSIADPLASHESNVDGFINVLDAARQAGVARVVYASSSSVYGDIGEGPKVEDEIGNCLSPYAATKRIDEVYAQVYGKVFGMETVGLRYFNVFGPRQDPNGPYAAVVPRWLAAMAKREPVVIFGDGSTSRDFCYIANVVQANILAASVGVESGAINSVINIACGATTTLLQLERLLREAVARVGGFSPDELPKPRFEPFRKGDIPHSLATIDRAKSLLGYQPSHSVQEGISELVYSELT
ncbi:MAG: NAD-dependent epimerase/dehydratase family protein [Pseudomonadota bacterium]